MQMHGLPIVCIVSRIGWLRLHAVISRSLDRSRMYRPCLATIHTIQAFLLTFVADVQDEILQAV